MILRTVTVLFSLSFLSFEFYNHSFSNCKQINFGCWPWWRYCSLKLCLCCVNSIFLALNVDDQNSLEDVLNRLQSDEREQAVVHWSRLSDFFALVLLSIQSQGIVVNRLQKFYKLFGNFQSTGQKDLWFDCHFRQAIQCENWGPRVRFLPTILSSQSEFVSN